MSAKAQTSQKYHAIGKRKSAIASVFLSQGSGQIVVNSKPLENYFPFPTHRLEIQTPLKKTELSERFDVKVSVKGGGTNAQSIAVRHGISRALVAYDPELRKTLKPLGLLRRDDRVKERKKYGQKGARKRFQFSKR